MKVFLSLFSYSAFSARQRDSAWPPGFCPLYLCAAALLLYNDFTMGLLIIMDNLTHRRHINLS